MKNKKLKQCKAYLWLLPTLVLLALFSVYPVLNSFILSMTNANSTGKGDFIFFKNYIDIFKDNVFWICLKNVLIFTVVGFLCGNIMTILLAELLYNLRSKKVSSVFRVLFIIPILVPFIVITLVWRYIIFSDSGFANTFLSFFNVEPQKWYYGLNTAKLSIILTNFPWVGGTSFLIYLAGLQSISKDMVEASKLDGCSTFKRIIYIDMPNLRGQIKYFLIMGVIGGLQNFDLQLIITGSGVGTTNNTNVLGYYLYDKAFLSDQNLYGYASAVGVIIFILTMIVTIINLKTKKGEEA